MSQFVVYIIYSESIDRFYVGYSSDFEKRLTFHNDPIHNHIWTKRGQPWSVYLVINDLNKSQALKIERHIKKMKSRQFIQQLRQDPTLIENLKVKFG